MFGAGTETKTRTEKTERGIDRLFKSKMHDMMID